MNSKLKLWDQHKDWDNSEKIWNENAKLAACLSPNKGLKVLPQMAGITPEAAKHLKWKALKWIIAKDRKRKILKGILHHPLKYIFNYVKSCFKSKPYVREGDFFLYGTTSLEDFEKLLRDPATLFVMGFSYCHKPFECPSGRFTSECVHDAANPICQQCFIGKCIHASSSATIPLLIPTIHYIGEQIFDIVHKNPSKKIVFLITACEMTLEMFGDFGNMVGIKGVGIRLDGRICNTMQAFQLSEEGTKPGLTVVLESTQEKMLRFLRAHRESSSSANP